MNLSDYVDTAERSGSISSESPVDLTENGVNQPGPSICCCILQRHTVYFWNCLLSFEGSPLILHMRSNFTNFIAKLIVNKLHTSTKVKTQLKVNLRHDTLKHLSNRPSTSTMFSLFSKWSLPLVTSNRNKRHNRSIQQIVQAWIRVFSKYLRYSAPDFDEGIFVVVVVYFAVSLIIFVDCHPL